MKNIVFIFPAGCLPVPAVKGGAIENLIELLINENEKNKEYMFHIIMCKKKSDKTNYDYSKYKCSKFYDFYMSENWYKINRIINAGNKRLNYIFSLNSPFDKFIIKTTKQINPDLIIYEGTFTSSVRVLKKYFSREKLIYHIHHQITLKKDLSKFFARLLCASNFIKTDWEENFKFKNQITPIVLPNAIDSSRFNKTVTYEEKQQLRTALGLAHDDFVAIYVGRLIPIKGIDKLIMAIKNIDNPKIKLLIVGASVFKGSKKTEFTEKLCELSKGLEDRIIFTGFIDNSEVYKYYAIADVHVVPSVCEEAAGLVALESKSVGVAQIVTNSGGLPECVNKSAVILNKENNLEEKLTKAIVTIYNNKQTVKPEKATDEKFYYEEFSKIVKTIM